MRTDYDKLMRFFGGPSSIVHLLSQSPYRRKDQNIPTTATICRWKVSGIPDGQMLRIALAYEAKHGRPFDLTQFCMKVGERPQHIRPSTTEIRDGRRVLKERLVTPMHHLGGLFS